MQRRKMTFPEVLLWQQLRKEPDDVQFRRQHPAGPYVLDFFCHEAAVAIEVDGLAHDLGSNLQRDIARDAWVADQGIQTLRFRAIEVRGSAVSSGQDFTGARLTSLWSAST